MTCLAANRSESSYVAGGIALNRDWPRLSDDIDIFQDTDEEVASAAQRDIETLRRALFGVDIEVLAYGIVEAVVRQNGEATIIQWMSESRRRFLPLVRDEAWGAKLHLADLAVNKVVAASTRQKARDIVDLVAIAAYLCPLGPLVLAACGKPPFYAPTRIIEEIRRHGLGLWDEDYRSVKGIPADWQPASIRQQLVSAMEGAQSYVMHAPDVLVGALALDQRQVPVEVRNLEHDAYILRRATEEPEVMPQFKDTGPDWQA